MNLTFDPTPYNVLAGVLYWLQVVSAVLAVAVITVSASAFSQSGFSGLWQVVTETFAAFGDWFSTSPQRIWGITMLTIRESMRKKAPAVIVVFGLLLLFAGWFLTKSNTDAEMQLSVHVSFVLSAISWLILPLVLLQACWGIPDDIRARSLHTVVTKPVRRHEVLLGRILGFSIVGLTALLLMSAAGLVWIDRQIPDSARERLVARVPLYGDIRWKSREGEITFAGISQGDEWSFRSYVEGNTQAAAIWDFSGVTLDSNGDLQLESSFQSFRTHKGNIEKGLLTQFTLVSIEPDPTYSFDEKPPYYKFKELVRVPLAVFENQENRENRYFVKQANPKLFQEATNAEVQLADLVKNGLLRVEARCKISGQLLGMARTDLFIRLDDKPFWVSYFKSVAGIGLMLVVVITLAVCSSCFVKGIFALVLVTSVLLVARTGSDFMNQLLVQTNDPMLKWEGGGLIESVIRIYQHTAPTVGIDSTPVMRVVRFIDNGVFNNLLWAARHVMFPEFKYFYMSEFTAKGFDVPWNAALLPAIAVTIGYCIPWILIGYFSLKFRELELK